MLPDTSMDACRRVLEPFHDRLFTVASNAWDRYMLIPAEARVALARWKRARANAVWAFMMDAAQVLFENDPAVRSRLAFDTLTFEFCNTVLVRFKKMDAEGLSSNYPTARAESYNNSGQFEMFAEMWSAPIRVDVGYFPNDLGIQLEHVWVTRRIGGEVDWRYEILPPAQPLVISFPEPVTPHVPAQDGRVVARQTEPAQQLAIDPKAGA